MDFNVIVTVPPYAKFVRDIARHPRVSGLRLNTVMPLADPIERILDRLESAGKPLWVDLKGRQLRVTQAAVPPFTEVVLSHPIDLLPPADAYFSDGQEHARIVAVDGRRIILEDTPRRMVGPGESVNILAPSLHIEGTLTDTDKAYLDVIRRRPEQNVMLSFVESADDVRELALGPQANVVSKIESNKGLQYIRNTSQPGRLMAARGDLYVEVVRPHRILDALHDIIARDPNAIVASRLFPSLAYSDVPSCQDIGDFAALLMMGYRSFMLGDEICLRYESIQAALEVMDQVYKTSRRSSVTVR